MCVCWLRFGLVLVVDLLLVLCLWVGFLFCCAVGLLCLSDFRCVGSGWCFGQDLVLCGVLWVLPGVGSLW